MQIPIYYLDTFTNQLFKGNPAAVCLLPQWPEDVLLHNIAKENNLPVTAFLVRQNETFHIRWITPEYELDLCGHGTLAATFIVFNNFEPSWHTVNFKSRTESFQAFRNNDLITLNFPVRTVEQCETPTLLIQGLGLIPYAVYQHRKERYLVIYDNEEEIKQLNPNMQLLRNIEQRGVVVTAKGSTVDFVSRTFYPQKLLTEDAVTGASHCLLVPYWTKQLGKTKLHAQQLSKRGGELFCELQNNNVLISGKVVIYMQGIITLNN